MKQAEFRSMNSGPPAHAEYGASEAHTVGRTRGARAALRQIHGGPPERVLRRYLISRATRHRRGSWSSAQSIERAISAVPAAGTERNALTAQAGSQRHSPPRRGRFGLAILHRQVTRPRVSLYPWRRQLTTRARNGEAAIEDAWGSSRRGETLSLWGSRASSAPMSYHVGQPPTDRGSHS